MKKTKRYKSSENYEECYLRIGELKKALENPDNVKASTKPEFKKVVNYMATHSYNKNYAYLKKHGFEFEDLYSVVTLYSISFMESKKNFKTDKDKYTLMMRYITQRLNLFYKTMDRKFKIKEQIVEISFEDYYNNFGSIEDFTGYSESESQENSATMSSEEKKLLRQKLQNNIEVYKEELQRMATSKFIEYKVRKAARKYCKINNIDYISWAKDLIKKNNLDINDFILET
jgi:hypothetical protein